MNRRAFLQAAAIAPLAFAAEDRPVPEYKIVSRFAAAERMGMPGLYPGQVVSTHAEKCIDAQTGKPDAETVREMMMRGMRALTGDKDARDAWARFFDATDVVGIKVNCSGAPGIASTPEVVAEIVRNLMAVGVKPDRIRIYERFREQVDLAHYERYVPEGVDIWAAEVVRGDMYAYDPTTYVDCMFGGEEDTRSSLMRQVTERFTKIVNVPNMKDHGAAGVTGCLKNIAYGNFSNVARSHVGAVTHTYSFVGTLAAVQPLRSRTVLQVMDGLRGVWHGGPFLADRRFLFYPKQLLFGTDPVAMDRTLLDIIEDKRKAERANSVWERSMAQVRPLGTGDDDPNITHYLREPGHIEYAARLGLGVFDSDKIRTTRVEI